MKQGNAIHIGVIAGVTMIVAGAGDANAVPIIQTQTFNLSDSGSGNVSDSIGLEFASFDTGLGTLTDVVFTLDSTNSARQDLTVSVGESSDEGSESSPLGEGVPSAEGTFLPTFTVSFGSQTLFLDSIPDPLQTACEPSSGEPCSDSDFFDSSAFNGTFAIDGVDTEPFDNGGFFDIDVRIASEFSVESFASAQASVVNDASWNGTLKVAYTFTPATPASPTSTVPEPGTLALFGIGLAGLGYLGRRRRRK